MSTQELIFTDYADILTRRRSTVVLFFAATVVLVIMGTLLMTPMYQAQAVLLIDVESPNVVATTANVELTSQGTGSYYSYREYFKSQLAILTSYPILRQVFDEFKLYQLPEYASARDPLKKFAKIVTIEPVRETRLANLNVENKDPVLATQIANRIADLYIRHNLNYISKSEWLNLLKNEYLRLDARMSEYSKIYKEGHPEMIRLKNEMADVVKSISLEKGSGAIGSTAVYEKYRSQFRGALAGLKANNVSVIQYAAVPQKPEKPNKLLNLLMAIVAGLFGGVGLAFFFEYQDATVRDVEDIERLTSWPVLGKVPVIDGQKKEMNVHLKPDDIVSESYKTIRTQVLLSDTKERPLKTIVLSSFGAQEGKTLTICNLAIALASAQKRVLLVDADMRRPRLHEILKKKETGGLCSLLSGKTVYEDIIHRSEIENLSFITDGHSCQNSTELLSADKMRDFIAYAKKNYDYILFDTPPVGIVSDATLLATMVDGMIIVLESGKTPKKVLLRQEKLLKSRGINVVGIIINRVVVSGSEGYYYSKSYHTRGKD